MNFKSFKQRRDFLKTASTVALASGIPTLDILNNVALAAGGVEPSSVDSNYKAIVCVFLYGGQDNANILIPYRDSNGTGTTEYNRYRTGRANGTDAQNQSTSTGDLSYSNAQLAATALNATAGTTDPGINSVFTNHTYGRRFALHPSYVELASLYNSGKLAVISNVGPLVSPLHRGQWYTNTGGPRPLNLYSHDDQQKAWMSGTADKAAPERGIGGRIAAHPSIAILNSGAQVSTQISLDLSSGLRQYRTHSQRHNKQYRHQLCQRNRLLYRRDLHGQQPHVALLCRRGTYQGKQRLRLQRHNVQRIPHACHQRPGQCLDLP